MKDKIWLRFPAVSGMILLFFMSTEIAYSQTAPVIGLHENTPNVIAFTNARLITAPGTILDNATLVIRNGYIDGVGENIDIPPDHPPPEVDPRSRLKRHLLIWQPRLSFRVPVSQASVVPNQRDQRRRATCEDLNHIY